MAIIVVVVDRKLNIPVGTQSLEDLFFMSQAEKLGLPFTSGMVLYNKISREARIGFKEIRNFLTRFATVDADRDGWITPEDMATFLSVPNDACLQALFSTTDKVFMVHRHGCMCSNR